MGIPLVALMGRQPQILDYGQQMAQGQQIQGMRNQNALAPGQMQLQQQQIEAQKRQLEQQQAVNDAYKQAFQSTPDGRMQLDPDALQKALATSGHGSAVPAIVESLTNMQKLHNEVVEQNQKIKNTTADVYGHVASAIQQAGYDKPLSHALIDTIGDPSNPQVQQLHQLLDQDQLGKFKQLVDGLAAASPAQQALKNARDVATIRAEKNPTTASLAVDAARGDIQAQAALDKLQEQKPDKSDTEATLAVKAAQGDKTAEIALKRLDQSKRESRPITNIMTGNDAKDIADAIENGDQPPTLQGLYRNAGPVRAELARRGVPLAKMETDWKATQRYLSTLNGTQQTRLRQAISTASDSLDKIEGLYNEWQQLGPASGVKIINKGALAASKQLPGRTGAVATALDAQIADLTSELGNVYMGGNSPTDHSLSLAAKNLSSDWNKATFDEALKQTRANIKIRQNSIIHAAPAGVGSEYFQGGGAEAAPAKSGTGNYTPPVGAKTATGPNGHKIVVDGGKWVDAQTGKPI